MSSRQNESAEQRRYMRRAFGLARRTWPSPNPRVGAVIVRDDEVVGRGRHMFYGGPHAEINALAEAGTQARGAVLYVTLEPCCHQGQTGPCTEAIVRSGIRRVVAGCVDPNPKVAGKGFAELRKAGVEVVEGVMREKTQRLIAGHSKFTLTGLPYVVWKYAMTLDGRIATSKGESKWITGEQSRREVHNMRQDTDAVVTGIGTVLADDPELTVRMASPKHQPLRVIMDSNARLPLNSRLLAVAGGKVIVIVCDAAPARRRRAIEDAGAIVVPMGETRVDIGQAFRFLTVEHGVREVRPMEPSYPYVLHAS